MPVFDFVKNNTRVEKFTEEKKKELLSTKSDLTVNGQTYRLSQGAISHIKNGTINSYTPVDEEEKKTLENFKNNYKVDIIDSKGVNHGQMSYGDVQKITGFYNSDFRKAPVLSVVMPTAEKYIVSTLPDVSREVWNNYTVAERQYAKDEFNAKYDPNGIAAKYGLDASKVTEEDVNAIRRKNGYSVRSNPNPYAMELVIWTPPKDASPTLMNDIDFLSEIAANNTRRENSNEDLGVAKTYINRFFNGLTFGGLDYVAQTYQHDGSSIPKEMFVNSVQEYQKSINEHETAANLGSFAGTMISSLVISGSISGVLGAAGWATTTAPIARQAVVEGLTGVLRGGATEAVTGGDWGDIGLAALRDGLTSGLGGAVDAGVTKVLGKLFTNTTSGNRVLKALSNVKDTKLATIGINTVGGLADATVDYAADLGFVAGANYMGADLEYRTGDDLLTSFGTTLILGTVMNMANSKAMSAEGKAKLIEMSEEYAIAKNNLFKSFDDTEIDYKEAADKFIELGNDFKKKLDGEMFPGQKKTVDGIKQYIDTVNDNVRRNVENLNKAKTDATGIKTPVSTETSTAPKAKTVSGTVPVSTEGGVITSTSKSIDNIVSGKATNKDYDLFKVGQAENRKAFEDATGIKLPATNSETRKFLRDFANKTPVERVLSDIPEAQRSSIIETANKITEGTEKTSEQLVAEVKGISDNVSATIKNQFGIDVDNGRLLEINLKALADNPENIITNDFVRGYSEVIGEKLTGINPKTLENNYFGKAPLGGKLADYGNKFKTVVDSSAQTLKAEYEGMQSTKVVGDVLHTVNTEYTHMYDVDKVEQGFVDSVNSEIEQAIENIRSGNVEKVPDNIEVTKLTDKTKSDLGGIAGFDISDYSCKIEKDTLFHIEDRHGMNGKHDSSLSDPQDVARMGYIINNYDNVVRAKDKNGKDVYSRKYNDKNNRPSPVLMMTKKIDGTYCVSYVVPDSKKKTLWITSARIQKADVGSQVPNGNTPQLTPEAPLVSSSANNNIPQKADTVNNEYMPKSGEVFTDNSENGFTRIDDIDDSFGVRISEGKNEYGNDVLKIDIDNPDVDAVTDSAEYKRLSRHNPYS